MSKAVRVIARLGLAMLLGSCATNIQQKPETIVPSKEPFGNFAVVVMRPLSVEHMEGDSGDQAAVSHIQGTLRECMTAIFPKMVVSAETVGSSADGRTLLVEPAIVDLKKVNGAERFFLGPMVGSSAVLLRMRFTDLDANGLLAEPVFYAKANAWGGAFTIGATDNVMLQRLTNQACDYSRKNR